MKRIAEPNLTYLGEIMFERKFPAITPRNDERTRAEAEAVNIIHFALLFWEANPMVAS